MFFAAGLSTGAVFGIFIAILVVIILVGLAIYVLWVKTKGKPSGLVLRRFIIKVGVLWTLWLSHQVLI